MFALRTLLRLCRPAMQLSTERSHAVLLVEYLKVLPKIYPHNFKVTGEANVNYFFEPEVNRQDHHRT